MNSIESEEATKNYLILPFIQQILGYNPFDPNELIPEYNANVGAARKFKLDYAILQDSQPVILIECKCYGTDIDKDSHYTQLFSYYAATNARIGILTDGVVYQFFADLDKTNKMDKNPFLTINLLNLKESEIKELSKLTKSAFDVSDVINSASELKYVGGIKSLLKKQMQSPSEDFVRYFFKKLCPDNAYTGQLKQDFLGYTLRGINEFITEEMKSMVDDFVKPHSSSADSDKAHEVDEVEPEPTEFTEDERDAYYIIKAIVSSVIEPARVTYRDTRSYCNILLDNNGRRKIARLYFNNPKNKKIVIFSIDGDGSQNSETFSITDLNQIHEYADMLKAIATSL